MVDLASGVLIFSFILAGYATWAAFMGGRWRNEQMIVSAERSAIALLVLSSATMAALVYAFVTRDFSLEYVAHYSNHTLPMFYTISAVWAGQSGSLLLWAWLLCLFAAIVVWQNRKKSRELLPYVLATILFTAFFFLGLMVYATSPFARLPQPVADGSGLNPMLQNPGMVMHPPTLYLGYVGFTVPFAYALAALFANRLDAQWIRSTRRWTLFSWLFLTLGNLFGAKWAYVELGWGGYWAWDPVENALAHRHGVSAFGDDSRKARHVESVESRARHSHLRSYHLRHVHHPQRHHQLRALLRCIESRPAAFDFPRSNPARLARPAVVALAAALRFHCPPDC